MKIRDVKAQDIPAIIDLHKKAMIPIWERFGRDYNLKKLENSIKQSIGKDKLITVEIKNRIVGCGRAKICDDETSEDVICYLDMILVHPDFQRRGIGKEMMKFLENFGKQKGATKFALEVIIGNAAVDFYKKLGYREKKVIMDKVK